LTVEEAKTLWSEIDQFNHGAINGNTLQRWFEIEAGFVIPSTDIHFLYDAFKSYEFEHRITERQWVTALAGPQPPEEEPAEQPKAAEADGPKEAPTVNKNGTSLRKKKLPEPADTEKSPQKNIR